MSAETESHLWQHDLMIETTFCSRCGLEVDGWRTLEVASEDQLSFCAHHPSCEKVRRVRYRLSGLRWRTLEFAWH